MVKKDSVLMTRLKKKFPKFFKRTNEDIIVDIINKRLTLVDYREDDQKIMGTLRIRGVRPMSDSLVDELCEDILEKTSLQVIDIRVINYDDDIKQIVLYGGESYAKRTM